MPDEYVFYVDGRETWRNRHGGVSQVKQHLFVNDEIDEAAGDIRKAFLPDRFLVDYVRIYELLPAAGGKQPAPAGGCSGFTIILRGKPRPPAPRII